jgi:hypothetical protein
MRNTAAGKCAFAGLMLSLTLLALLLTAVLPVNKLFLLAVSSVFTSLVLLECGRKWAWLFYLAASALGLWLLPLGPGNLAYVFFFGNWGLVREFLTSSSKYLALLLKLAYFNLMLLALYWLAVRLGLSPKLPFSFAMALFWLASQAGLLVYDRALQLFLVYYAARFQAR